MFSPFPKINNKDLIVSDNIYSLTRKDFFF